MPERLKSAYWWAAYALVVFPVCILASLAWGLPGELLPVLAASAAGFRFADVVTRWLRGRGE